MILYTDPVSVFYWLHYWFCILIMYRFTTDFTTNLVYFVHYWFVWSSVFLLFFVVSLKGREISGYGPGYQNWLAWIVAQNTLLNYFQSIMSRKYCEMMNLEPVTSDIQNSWVVFRIASSRQNHDNLSTIQLTALMNGILYYRPFVGIKSLICAGNLSL